MEIYFTNHQWGCRLYAMQSNDPNPIDDLSGEAPLQSANHVCCHFHQGTPGVALTLLLFTWAGKCRGIPVTRSVAIDSKIRKLASNVTRLHQRSPLCPDLDYSTFQNFDRPPPL
ncbi:hypothetical protein HAX54_011785 [Datura stramonium]|uniref:Uncharacterized protein n=1 Tax=Datura stramonium TaxID=4076 RepID=A0ABS8TKI6_DATST|nr:hypothetical protein [Datura stramonium]